MKSTVEWRTLGNDLERSRTSARNVTVNQTGLTLIELIIALAIIGLVSGGIVMAIHQLLTASGQSNDQQYAVSQLRQAEHWMSRDTLMAQSVTLDADPSGFPIELSWTTSAGNGYLVTYSLLDMPTGALKRLQSQEILTAPDNSTSTSTLAIADSIDASLSSCTYTELTRVLSVTLTATSRTHTETRTFEALRRPED